MEILTSYLKPPLVLAPPACPFLALPFGLGLVASPGQSPLKEMANTAIGATRAKALLGHWWDTLDQWGTQEPHSQHESQWETQWEQGIAQIQPLPPETGSRHWGFFKKHPGNWFYQ